MHLLNGRESTLQEFIRIYKIVHLVCFVLIIFPLCGDGIVLLSILNAFFLASANMFIIAYMITTAQRRQKTKTKNKKTKT